MDVPVDDESKLNCPKIVSVLVGGSPLVNVVGTLMILLLETYPSRPGWSWIVDVVVVNGYSWKR